MKKKFQNTSELPNKGQKLQLFYTKTLYKNVQC